MMLAKLYKYDMKSIIRQMGVIWILCPVVATIFAFTIQRELPIDNGEYDYMPTIYLTKFLPMIFGLTLFGIVVAMLAMTVIFVIQRFWKGLLGDEGYLMFTLPVKTRYLIFSKMLSAITVVVIGAFSGFVAFLLLLMVLNEGVQISEIIKAGFDFLKGIPGGGLIARYIFLGIFLFFSVLIMNIYHIYLAMAIGQLVTKYKIAAVVVSYMVINLVINTIMQGGGAVAGLVMKDNFHLMPGMLLAYGIVQMIFAVAFHCGIEYIFKNRLNLE